ncbi:MAG: transporter substrate-binding domain-containing protein [Spirochaetales bacterium]|uniref:Transporter substrate-binding domain-containing protein n=1 Tax=Candidatus Thalassospirochaeta sargassi TaxID=3119039 RepID=A0AAJ1MKE7_9SPIO|nr:transporter substrate-binding domain-containing protein [Spirochaetales bacterium]
MKRTVLLISILVLIASFAIAGGQQESITDDWAYIQDKGELIVGITIFSPMNYYDDNGELIGFETEFTEAVCEKLGITPEFVEINWDTKEIELASKKIDAIWNGMTVTPERAEKVLFSTSYIRNMQVAVVKKANLKDYTSKDDLMGKVIAAEVGSAGEDAARTQVSDASVISVSKQTDALLEVKAGTVDAAILDYTLAVSMTGSKGDYADLAIAGEDLYFAIEEYAVAFRLGSSIVPLVNEAIEELAQDGTLQAIAEKYELESQLLINQ